MSFALPSPNYQQPSPPPTPDSDYLRSTIWSSRQFITRKWFRTLYIMIFKRGMDHHYLLLWLWSDMIFVSDDIPAKIPQKLNYESKKIQILGENGINSKLKHRKLITRFLNGDLVTRTGVTRRSVLYPEELASTQLIALLSGPLCFLADLPPILPCQPSLVSQCTHYLQACRTPRAGKGKKSWDSPNFLGGKVL